MPRSKTRPKNTKAKKTTARRATPKASTAKSATNKKATDKKAAAKNATSKAPARVAGHSAKPVTRPASAMPARPGDLIVIDSAQVGSPAREGEILKVIAGELSVSYQVRWGDGHETLITPAAGTAHIART